MRQHGKKRSQLKKLSYLLVLGASLGSASPTAAQNAGDVLDRMGSTEQASYIAGVVEGLAYSRFLRDRPDEAGMSCIYDWYYNGQAEKWTLIEQWFSRHPERPVGAMLYVLIGRDCGE